VRVSVVDTHSSTAVFTTPTTLRYIQPHHSSSRDATTTACFVQCSSSSSAVTFALSSSNSSSTSNNGAIAVTGLAYELHHGSVQEVYDTDLEHLQQHQQQQQQQLLSSGNCGAAHTTVASHIVKSSTVSAATIAARSTAAKMDRYSSCDSPPPRQHPPDAADEPLIAELLTEQLSSPQQWTEAAAASADDGDAAYSALLSSQSSTSSELKAATAADDDEEGLELRSPPRSRTGTGGLSSREHTVASVGHIVVRTVSSTAVSAGANASAGMGTVMSPRCVLVTQQSYSGAAAPRLGEPLPVRAATAPATAALAAAAAAVDSAEIVVPGTADNSVALSAQQHLQQLLEDDAQSLSGAVSEIAMSDDAHNSGSAVNVLQRSSSTASATTAGAAASAANSHPSSHKQQQQQQRRGAKRARYRSLCTTTTRFEYNSMGERVRVQVPLTELEGYGGPREELRNTGKFSLARTPAPAVPTVSTVRCHIEGFQAAAATDLQTAQPALQQGLPRGFAQCWSAHGRGVVESCGRSAVAAGVSGSGGVVKGKGDTATLAREALDVAEAVGVQCFAKALYAVYMQR
jgi:hypothetical protein